MAGTALLSNAFIRIRGPDAAKFLNGLMTTRLSPHLVKKKEHTISTEVRNNQNLTSVDMLKNWGVMYEDIFQDETIRVLRGGVFSMFLNSKGRVITDCFNYPYPFHTKSPVFCEAHETLPNYLVEVAEKNASKLLMLLKIHKLSANVTIEKAAELHSYYHFDDKSRKTLANIRQKYFMTESPIDALEHANALIESQELFSKEAANDIAAFAIDNRIENFGLKIITTRKIEDPSTLFSDSFASQFSTELIPEAEVRHRRFQHGLFETADAPDGQSLLPFEAGLDFNTGISLDKGCYIGQELTIRTYNLGVIRKRIVPITFDDDVSGLLAGVDFLTVVIERESKSADEKLRRGKLGKLLSVDGNLGFLLTAFEDIFTDDRYVAIINGQRFGLTATIPAYWESEEISEE